MQRQHSTSPEPQVFAALRTLPASEFEARGDISPNAIGASGQSLLHEAIAYRRTELVPGLVRRGVPVDHRNPKGETALHYAAMSGLLEATQMLLSAGANANALDQHGNSPLWYAAMTSRDSKMVSTLVEAGADPTHKNNAGRSVLDFARQSNNKQLWLACGRSEAGLHASSSAASQVSVIEPTLEVSDMPSVVDTSGTPDEVARWIWKNLVPESGQASSLQGELLRAIEKLRWEAQENGNINWDDRFEMFVDLLRQHLLSQDFFSPDEKTAIAADLDRLTSFITPDEVTDDHSRDHMLPYVEDDLYDRLTAHVVTLCRYFPQVIRRRPDPRQYR